MDGRQLVSNLDISHAAKDNGTCKDAVRYYVKMVLPRLHTREFHPWKFRTCLLILCTVAIINTAFHWALVDVHSRSSQRNNGDEVAKGEDVGAHLRGHMSNTNDRSDEEAADQNGGKGNTFHVGQQERYSIKQPIAQGPVITYITRKPSNRRPLGELPVNRDVDTNSIFSREQLKQTMNVSIRSKAHFAIRMKENVTFDKVEVRRKHIRAVREKVQISKHDIRSRVRVATLLPFLRQSHVEKQGKPPQDFGRKLYTNKNVGDFEENSTKLESLLNCTVLQTHREGNVRYYSQPGWLNIRDIDAMNILAGGWILRKRGREKSTAKELDKLVLVFRDQAERLLANGRIHDSWKECESSKTPACRTGWCHEDLSQIVAYHLDRIIGLHVTLPTVARELPIVLRQPDKQHPVGSDLTQGAGHVRVIALTIITSPGDVQPQHVTITPTYESRQWANTRTDLPSGLVEKLAIFCFLLQISNCSIDRIRSDITQTTQRPQRFGHGITKEAIRCVEMDQSPIGIFTSTGVPAERDFSPLDTLKSISRENINLLQSGQIRQRLLQSLFVDRVFWAEAGGRRGIEEILNILDRRIKYLVNLITKTLRRTEED